MSQDNRFSLQDNGLSLQDKALVETTLKQLKQRLKSDVLCGIKSFECLKGRGFAPNAGDGGMMGETKGWRR